MERTIISFNLPNLITIPLMAFLGFLVVGLIWQVAQRAMGQSDDASASTAGGY